MRAVWTCDLHLDRLNEEGHSDLIKNIASSNADTLIIAGDIATADILEASLERIYDGVSKEIFFVLGNHDYWGSSMCHVDLEVRRLVERKPNLHWLTESGIVEMDGAIAMIGHEGWGDGLAGDYQNADGFPYDFRWIEDFVDLSKGERWEKMKSLGERAAIHLHEKIIESFRSYEHVYVVTHVPPFPAACRKSDGTPFSSSRLPFYVCQAVGDMLVDLLKRHPRHRVTVICGHTHQQCDLRILENLHVRVRSASYRSWHAPEPL